MSAITERLTEIVFKEENKLRISYIGLTSALFMLSILLICLIPSKTYTTDGSLDRLLERHIILVLCVALVVVCPLGLLAVCVDNPSINSTVLLFVVGIGSGSLCAITFSMIFLNIFMTFIDIITGNLRQNVMEIIGTNILMIAFTIMLYFKTSLSKELYDICVENEKNLTNNGVTPVVATEPVGVLRFSTSSTASNDSSNGKPTPKAYSKKTGSYDFNESW